MLNSFRVLLASACLIVLAVHTSPASAQAREEARLLVATEVLDELLAQRDQNIPQRLLQQAYGVAVIPNVTKVAFILGGRRGSGVLTVRDSRGRFSSPVFINLTGGSVGWQIGAQETDVVLVFTSKRGVEGIADGKLTLGAGASVAAGPVGRQGEAAAGIDAEVLAYSQTRGLFAGVALDGTAITMDRRGNGQFYGRSGVLTSDILNGTVTKDSENVRRFLAALARGTGESATDNAAAPAAPPASNAGAGSPAAAPMEGGAVRTFPMEDQAPGGEPPR